MAFTSLLLAFGLVVAGVEASESFLQPGEAAQVAALAAEAKMQAVLAQHTVPKILRNTPYSRSHRDAPMATAPSSLEHRGNSGEASSLSALRRKVPVDWADDKDFSALRNWDSTKKNLHKKFSGVPLTLAAAAVKFAVPMLRQTASEVGGIRKLFEVIDTDWNGNIEAAEFTSFLAGKVGPAWTRADTKFFMKQSQIDSDKNGAISFAELKKERAPEEGADGSDDGAAAADAAVGYDGGAAGGDDGGAAADPDELVPVEEATEFDYENVFKPTEKTTEEIKQIGIHTGELETLRIRPSKSQVVTLATDYGKSINSTREALEKLTAGEKKLADGLKTINLANMDMTTEKAKEFVTDIPKIQGIVQAARAPAPEPEEEASKEDEAATSLREAPVDAAKAKASKEAEGDGEGGADAKVAAAKAKLKASKEAELQAKKEAEEKRKSADKPEAEDTGLLGTLGNMFGR